MHRFLAPAFVYAVPAAVDFIGARDFDGDSHWDVVAARKGDKKLYLLSGDGHGGLRLTRQIELPGKLTALVVGEINRRDGLDDVVVGVSGESGAKVLVYEGPLGALRAEPEVIAMTAEVTSLALGQLDDDNEMDLAVAAGRDLVVVHGRDRMLSLDRGRQAEVAQPRVSKRSFPFLIRSIALGDFTGNRITDIAILSEESSVSVLSSPAVNGASLRANKAIEQWRIKVLANGSWSKAAKLVRVWAASVLADSLVVVDPSSNQLRILADDTEARAYKSEEKQLAANSPRHVLASFDVEGQPMAVLPMRLNGDGLSDLVLLRSQNKPSVALTETQMAFTVTNINDSGPGSLRQAILDANSVQGQVPSLINFNIPGPPPHTITPTSPLPTVGSLSNFRVDIDGTTQPGFAGKPVIELNGTSAGGILRNSNSSAPADLVFSYGPAGAGWIPVVGDWNGDGTDTIGLYNHASSSFFLRNTNSSAPADLVFSYGPAGAGWKPVTGDWNGDGTDTIGLHNPASSSFFLSNTNTSAAADLVFSYGPAGAGWVPIVGDWDGL